MRVRTMRSRTRRRLQLLACLALLIMIGTLTACRAAATEPLAPTCYYWKVDTLLPAYVQGAPPNTITVVRTCVVHGR